MTELNLFLFLNDFIITLAVWRICVLLIDDNWPFNIMLRFRTWLGVYDLESHNWVAELFSCVYCMSLWVLLVLMPVLYWVGMDLPQPGLRFFAYSAGAVIIDYKMTGNQRSAR